MMRLRAAVRVGAVFLIVVSLACPPDTGPDQDPDPTTAPTITSFTAAPASLPSTGGTVTLTWQVTGASTVSISPGVGSVTPTASGSRTVNVTATTTFTLTATNTGGTVTATASATVAAADNQSPTASITSPGPGSFLTGSVNISVNATDNVGVTRVEMFVDGVLAATDNTAPWEFIWNTDPLSDGGRNLVARAYDAANNQGSSSVVGVTIRHPFVLTFRNLVHSDITLTATSQGTQTVPTGGTRTLTYTSNPGTVTFSGSTSGKTTSGTQVGLLMSWNDTFSATGLRTATIDLFLSSTYFFVRVTNCGSVNLFNFYVNYNSVSYETYDNISIANDCGVKNIGYYRAFTNTQVRAYRSSTLYVYWDQGTHFTLPFTSNQSVTLLNSIAGVANTSTPVDWVAATATALFVPPAPETPDWLTATSPATKQVAGHARESVP